MDSSEQYGQAPDVNVDTMGKGSIQYEEGINVVKSYSEDEVKNGYTPRTTGLPTLDL